MAEHAEHDTTNKGKYRSGFERQSAPQRMRAEARRIIKKQMRALKKREDFFDLPDAKWFADHAERFLAALDSGGTGTPFLSKKDATDLWSACLGFTETGLLPEEKSLAGFFATSGLSLPACAALPAALAAAAACKVARGFSPSRKTDGVAAWGARFLSALERLDPDALPGLLCETERLLLKDPAGVYPMLSPETKAAYRKALLRLAKTAGYTETAAARGILAACETTADSEKHIGAHLPLTKTYPRRFFFAAEIFFSLVCAGGLAAYLSMDAANPLHTLPAVPRYAAGAGLCCLFFLFFSSIFRPLWDRLAAKLIRPRFLPRLDEENGGVSLPPVCIAVSTLLPSADRTETLCAHLEDLSGAAGLPGCKVILLADLPAAKSPTLPTDEADIAAAKRAIDRLNETHGGGFLLLLRDRVYAPTEALYTGYERKRGAVEALVGAVADGGDGFLLTHGDKKGLEQSAYILALDADTGLPPGALKRLLCTAAHPLNRAVIENGNIKAGYGCFAPRICVSPESAGKTLFTRLFTGSDASIYTPRISERYMDLCGMGLFCGKGLIDVRAYREVCAGAFPAGTVLSHDMPEGALLRTAYISDAVLTEDFPARTAAWLRRAHRWLRGDVQNLRFLFGPMKKETPAKKLPALAKYQLLDNMRRAAVPPAAAAGLLLSALLPAPLKYPLLLLSALSVTAPELFFLLRAPVRCFCAVFCRRFFVPAPETLCRALALPFLRLGLLPAVAAVHLDAVGRAVFRSVISRKKTLEWTTAAQNEGKTDRAAGYTVLCPLLYSAALLPGGKPLLPFAALALLTVPFSLFAGKEIKKPGDALSDAGRETLRCYAAASWRYFERFVTEKTNFLPPDNVQETPVFRAAQRTSPTNIGLYLASLLAAADLRLIPPEALLRRLKETVKTLERLPKYRGLLYNWYDTETLEPLQPVFVSSVDCGNFLVCLTALREGLSEYLPLAPGLTDLIPRLRALEDAADLACLFDRRKRMFSVGYDAQKGILTDAAYTYYMSESRLTSFYAVAKGRAPLSHWGALARTTVGSRAVSFSGTAFEYLMPALFLPVLPNTFEDRGLRRAVAAQKRYAKKHRAPMGVSESGYYAFDGELNYLYKAHGLRRLSLSASPYAEPVFAPYAAFLTLQADKKAGMEALSRFAGLSAFGSCGFYEAVDFTGRAAPAKYRVVRSYMAHHVGMSLLAADNALRDDCFVRRFFADPAIRAAKGLLPEAFPAALPLRAPEKEKKNRRPTRFRQTERSEERGVSVFSDGEGTLICDKTGRNHFLYAGLSMLNFSNRSGGAFTAVAQGETVTPLTGFLPFSHKTSCVSAKTDAGGLKLSAALALAAGTGALLLPLRAENAGRKPTELSLLWYFEPGFFPVLQPPRHPTFRDMRMRAKYDPAQALLLFSKEENGSAGPWLCVGFSDGAPLRFSCDREEILGSDPCRPHPFAGGLPAFTDDTRFTQPAAAVCRRLRLSPGEAVTKTLLLVPGADAASAVRQLSALRRRPPAVRSAAKDLFLRDAAIGSCIRRLLGAAFFGETRPLAASDGGRPAGVRALWEQGIGGDLPLLRAKIDSLPPAALSSLLRAHALLASANVPFDLALSTDRPGVYGEAMPPALCRAMHTLGLSGFGGKGGRHLLRLPACSQAFLSALKAAPGADYPAAAALLPCGGNKTTAPPLPSSPLYPQENHFIPNGFYAGKNTLRPWSHVLSNRSFGTLVTNASLGFTWAMNARLNPVTPWSNDPCSHFSGERLELQIGKTTYDCVAGASAYFYDDKAVFGAACGGAKLRITVRVDAVAMKKEVTLAYALPPVKSPVFRYTLTPQLCENPAHAAFIRLRPAENGVIVRNSANEDFPGEALLCCDRPASFSTQGDAVVLTAPAPQNKGLLTFTLLYAAKEAGLFALRALPFRQQTPPRFRPHTGDPAADRFARALLLHQTLAVRLLARTGFYQNSGAYGFRDQLQDAMNLVPFTPSLTKTQLLRCAAAQFSGGDALHWFHVLPARAPRLFGARTLCADDRLWLPLAAAEYAEKTGDFDIFSLHVPYLKGEPLRPGERERCGEFFLGKETGSFYGHCIRAIRLTAENTGRHGLCLMLGGDWNDGLSEAGVRGQGESVWLTMFLKHVCERFREVALRQGEKEDAAFLDGTAQKANRATEIHGWNGGWFRRGYTDDGTPLGDPGNTACEIDLTVQAWATLANVGTKERQTEALRAAFRRLYTSDPPLVRLLDPPFGSNTVRAGYINDYPPGVRENGGQYTHAAVWFLSALRKAGMREEERAVLRAILPPTEEEALRRYKNEPYALSADVCASPELSGRGGWSLYTGAAGWLLRYFWERERDR